MKNKIVNVLYGITIVFVLWLIGCGLINTIDLFYNIYNIDTTKINEEIQEIPEFEKGKQYCDLEIVADFTTRSNGYIDNNTIYYDKNTGVMYCKIGMNNGGITPIYNSDGMLKLYEGELK